jgi:hypothetical protein
MTKVTRRPLIENLEPRRLMHAAIDLRLPGGGTTATVSTVGQVINLDIWMTVTGDDANGANEGLQSVNASLLSSNISGGAAAGTLVATLASPFDGSTSQNGTQKDLDSDGDLDIGSNDNTSADNFFIARANSMITSGIVTGGSKAFKVGTATFTVTSLLTGVQTNLTARTRASNAAFVYQEDGVARAPVNGGILNAGTGVTLKRAGNATISGRVFNDKNANGIFDGADTGIDKFRVFLDTDFDGVLDVGEVSKPVSATGTYNFTGVEAGTYRVREVFRTGWRQTFPALGYYQVTLGFGDIAKSQSFANTDTVLMKGNVFMDANKNRVKDAAEPGLAGWMLFIDHNKSGVLDKGDDWTLSDSKGNYRFFNLPAGTYQVRIVQQAKYTQTAPAGGFHTITLAAGGTTSNKNFGEKRLK